MKSRPMMLYADAEKQRGTVTVEAPSAVRLAPLIKLKADSGSRFGGCSSLPYYQSWKIILTTFAKSVFGPFVMNIETVEQLRTLYRAPTERLIKKQLSSLDVHCRKFIQLSPFVVIASTNRRYTMDSSPRGGTPGFVKVLDDQTLIIPDAPGNNRIDTFQNIIETGHVGLLFLIPGIEETLRVNGTARLSTCEKLVAHFVEEKHHPKLVIEMTVAEIFLHCPKALMRSKLWNPSAQVDRSILPTVIEMINDQTGIILPVQAQEEIRNNFAKDL